MDNFIRRQHSRQSPAFGRLYSSVEMGTIFIREEKQAAYSFKLKSNLD